MPGGDSTDVMSDTAHFTVQNVSGSLFMNDESVIIHSWVKNDEPLSTAANPVTNNTAAANQTGSKNTNASLENSTAGIEKVSVQPVIAELKNNLGTDITRSVMISLKNTESKTVTFDFGQLPAGSYDLTVMAPSYKNSSINAVVTVADGPLLSDWTRLGSLAIMLDDLEYDNVTVNVRNDGQHSLILDDTYHIFMNYSDRSGVELEVPNTTLITPGQTVSVPTKIPARGSYYLAYFSLRVPGHAGLIKIPVGIRMNPHASIAAVAEPGGN